eukprot:1161818-Pelagomonas_calceolata.AAC.6
MSTTSRIKHMYSNSPDQSYAEQGGGGMLLLGGRCGRAASGASQPACAALQQQPAPAREVPAQQVHSQGGPPRAPGAPAVQVCIQGGPPWPPRAAGVPVTSYGPARTSQPASLGV